MAKIVHTVEELIGNTPLFHLETNPQTGARLLVKLEFLNPGGSTKDRAALSMVRNAEERGLLAPGGTIIEPTSGNTGIGLACVAASRGYRLILTMPDTMSAERRAMLAAYGAQLVLTPGAQGMQGAVDKAEALAKEIPGSLIAGQFENPPNPDAHYRTTGPEIWQDTDGKIDIYVNIDLIDTQGVTVALDEAYTKSYIDALYRLRDMFDLKDDISVMRVASNRDIFAVTKPEEDTEGDWQDVCAVLSDAVDAFLAMREAEGERLREDICAKKAALEACVPEIEALSKEDTAGYAAKLEARLRQVLEDHELHIEESRILTECAIFADKVAVDEETVRLRSHFKAFDEMLLSEEPIGRKLDFLIQEMNRETNTIGSKANDMRIAKIVIGMKNEIEKIREQIQNIE